MIEWFPIFANTLWILGLAMLWATFSFQSYFKSMYGYQRPGESKKYGKDWPSIAGLVLFCLGMVLTSEQVLEKVLWGIMIVITLLWPYIENAHQAVSKKQ